MTTNSIFEIIGPVMVGPSSSHTLGAVRLGSFCRQFGGAACEKVRITLYGSFAHTYKGHGTDKALIGGLLGIRADDEALRDAFFLAKEAGLNYELAVDESDEYTGNIVRFDLFMKGGETHAIMGESIGGGRINIFKLDGMRVDISGEYASLITIHRDVVGMVAKITTLLSDYRINIAFLKLFREDRFQTAILVAQTDDTIPEAVLDELKENRDIEKAILIHPVV